MVCGQIALGILAFTAVLSKIILRPLRKNKEKEKNRQKNQEKRKIGTQVAIYKIKKKKPKPSEERLEERRFIIGCSYGTVNEQFGQTKKKRFSFRKTEEKRMEQEEIC